MNSGVKNVINPHKKLNFNIDTRKSNCAIPRRINNTKRPNELCLKYYREINMRNTSSSSSGKARYFPTKFNSILKTSPPQIPPSLLKIPLDDEVDNNSSQSFKNNNVNKKKDNGVGPGKVKVMLRVCPREVVRLRRSSRTSTNDWDKAGGILHVDDNRKNVELRDPDNDLQSARNRVGVSAPKIYSFDAVFPEDACQSEISNSCLVDVIKSVIQGADGAIFCYGHSGLGKTHTLFGNHTSTESLGVAPCAISWLYKAVEEVNRKVKGKYSIRVSALELFGRTEELRDLLADLVKDGPHDRLCVQEDPLFGTQVQNQCELRAGSAEKAAYMLDAALAARSTSKSNTAEEVRRHSHFVFTLHVHQYRTNNMGKFGATGGRSRLHLIDLGSCERTLVKTPTSLTLSLNSLGHVIMGIVNNSKHVPFKESKLTSILREVLGNFNCRAVMLAHVARNVENYADTLSTIQMASRIHRVLLKRKSKTSHMSSRMAPYGHVRCDSSKAKKTDEESIGTSSGIDGTSGSELSCDTVIYVRPNGTAYSDKELTDNEGPPISVPVRPLAKELEKICENTNGLHKNRNYNVESSENGNTIVDVEDHSVVCNTTPTPSPRKQNKSQTNHSSTNYKPRNKKNPPPIPKRRYFSDKNKTTNNHENNFNENLQYETSAKPRDECIFPKHGGNNSHLRQEPDGCDNAISTPCLVKQTPDITKYIKEFENALSALDQNDVCVAHHTTVELQNSVQHANGLYVGNRPESMTVNVNEAEWTRNTRSSRHVCVEDSDDSEVEVNFYCLSFTTNKNSVVPVSRKTLAKQIQKKRRVRERHPLSPSTANVKNKAEKPELKKSMRRTETFLVENNQNLNSNIQQKQEAVESLSGANSTMSSPSQQIVYDSSSLEINYIKPKSRAFPKESNNNNICKSEHKLSSRSKPRKDKHESKTPQLLRKKSHKDKSIKSKSASEIYEPKLTLVKSNGKGLELELTFPSDQNKNIPSNGNKYLKSTNLPRSKSASNPQNTVKIVDDKKRPFSLPAKNIVDTLQHSDQTGSTNTAKMSNPSPKHKKSPWSGLKRFGSKKSSSSSSSCKVTDDICFSRCATDVDTSRLEKRTINNKNLGFVSKMLSPKHAQIGDDAGQRNVLSVSPHHYKPARPTELLRSYRDVNATPKKTKPSHSRFGFNRTNP